MGKLLGGKNRNSNIEVLRLLAILTIIASHFAFHGILSNDILSKSNIIATWDWSIFFVSLSEFGGTFGNCTFILITGYFMINKSGVAWKKILLLIIAMYFYYWSIIGIFKATMQIDLTIKQIAGLCFPFLFGTHWFVCTYILFCLFIPFINPFLLSLNQKKFKKFLLIIFILGFVMPACGMSSYFVAKDMVLFGIMYSFGAYIRRFGGLNKRALNYIIIVDGILLIIATYILGRFFGSPGHTDVLSAVLSLAVFARTLLLKPCYIPFVNNMAKSVLGIYLIHENPLMRHFLWRDFYPNIEYLHMNGIVLLWLLKVFGVFIICLLVDQLRIMILEKPISLWLKGHWKKFGFNYTK